MEDRFIRIVEDYKEWFDNEVQDEYFFYHKKFNGECVAVWTSCSHWSCDRKIYKSIEALAIELFELLFEGSYFDDWDGMVKDNQNHDEVYNYFFGNNE